MRHIWTLVWQPDEQALTALLPRLPEHQVRRGPLVLASAHELQQTMDGKAIGILDGVIFNDLALAGPLTARGAPIVDHTSLALHTVGWSGLAGLATMRWHGTLAIVHQAQRSAIVARDWQGVGGLYWAQSAGAHVFANTSQALLNRGLTPRLVPPGMAAICLPSGVQWQVLPSSPAARAWFRELPEDLATPTPQDWQLGLAARLREALAACQRALPNLQQETPGDRVGTWLAAQLPLVAPVAADALWSLEGADAWLGLASAAPVEHPIGPWPEPEPPEPLRVDAREALARWVRATWLADVALESARQRAALVDLPIVAPHLDPAVLAWLGAMPVALRPLA